MTLLAEQLASLSPKQRRLLEMELAKQGIEISRHQIPPRSEDRASYPLSYAQQRLWFIDRLVPGNGAYHIALPMRMAGPLDVGALGRALTAIVARHEALRTNFTVDDEGQPVQVVHPPRRQALPVIDLTALAPGRRRAAAARLASANALAPFDLAADPLLRTRLLKLADDEHAFLLAMHHIVSDGWSMTVFSKEMKTLYAAFSNGDGRAPAALLPPLPIQYADFALWQRQRFQTSAFDDQLDYWRTHLKDCPTSLEMPFDRPRPAVQSFGGSVVATRFDQVLTARLRQLSKQRGTTLFVILLTAFQALLQRYTGRDDVVVGTPIANRNREEVEGLIGFFVNTLVLRTNVGPGEDGAPSFRELLDRTWKVNKDALSHQDVPLEKIVEDLHVERNLSHNPLYQVVFLVTATLAASAAAAGPRRAETGGGAGRGIIIQSMESESPTTPFDVMFQVFDEGPTLKPAAHYNVDLFDRTTVRRFLRHFELLVRRLATDLEARPAELELLTEVERFQVIEEWNDTRAAAAPGPSLTALFEAQAARSPGAVAVVAGGEELTYRELDERASRLGRLLGSLGVGPGAFVAVYLERSAEMVTALLGILKAGAAYAPMEIDLPLARVRFILNDLAIRCAVTQSPLAASLAELGETAPHLEHAICLDPASREPAPPHREGMEALATARRVWTLSDLDAVDGGSLPGRAGASDLAYIIFTSGSTGTPKGVVVRHQPVLNLIQWVNRSFGVGSDDRVLFLTSLSFDLSVYDVFGLLAAGGSIRVASRDDVRDPERLVEILLTEPVTFWDTAPAALTQLVSFLPPRPAHEARLRLVFNSGDWIPVTLPGRIAAAFPRVRMIALGGATEATVWSNFHPIGRVPEHWVSIPYGRPTADARYHVLDRRLAPCPVGVPGDLFIGGECLAAGYSDLVLTAGKFIPDPFAARPGGRLYRTGDRARYWADGELEFLGRLDHQVKVRGFRIELGEISTVLGEHPAIQDVAVIAREDESQPRSARHKRLVAFFVPRPETAAPPVAELRAHLLERLPEYMVPAVFMALEAMPVTANGKLDRAALARMPLATPEDRRAAEDDEVAEPRNEAEATLAEIWRSVLRVDRVGIHDNFFELGGDSILSIQIVARAQKAGLRLSPRLIFQNQTVAELAAAAETGEVEEKARPEVEPLNARFPMAGIEASVLDPLLADREPVEDVYPLGPTQHGFLFFALYAPESEAYFEQYSCLLHGDLELDSFRWAWEQAVRRHAVLRTSFLWEGLDEPLQVVHESVELPWRQEDWRGLEPREQQRRLDDFLRSDRQRKFDLSRAPALRLAIFQLRDNRFAFVCSFHHIILDGWCIPVLTQEGILTYVAHLRGRQARLPPVHPFRDYIAYLRALDPEETAGFWRRTLAGFTTPVQLAVDKQPGALPSQNADHRRYVMWLTPELTSSLNAFAQSHQITAATLVQGAWSWLLSHYSGQSDVVYGVVSSGRPAQLEGIETMIGLFITTIPLRRRVLGHERLLSWLREGMRQQYEAREHEYCALVDFQKWSDVPGDQPLFDTIILFQNLPTRESAADGGLVAEPEAEAGPAGPGGEVYASAARVEQRDSYALTLMAGTGQSMFLGLNFDADRFDPTTVRRFLRGLTRLLAQLPEDAERRLSELTMVTEGERYQLLHGWNDRHAEVSGTFAELFAAQAARTPKAIAAACDGVELTYAELDRRAGRLARRLAREGVGPECLVALLADRGLDFLTAMLALFQAGGAYRPLDPLHPPARLARVVKQSGVGLALVATGYRAAFDGAVGTLAPDDRPRVLELEAVLDREEPARELAGSRPQGLAYVIFTSGSTGLPKGAMVEQRGMINHLLAKVSELGLAAGDTVAQNASQCFDISVWQFLAVLLVGGRVEILPDRVAHDPAELVAAVERGITILETVPSLLRFLLEEVERRAVPLAGLRWLVPTGEALPPELARQWLAAHPRVPLLNAYGPTECSDDVSHFVLRSAPAPDAARIPIGGPLPNVRLYVVGPYFHLTAPQVPGELVVAGISVGRGYLDDPGRTAEVFVPDPFSAPPRGRAAGERLYRTGDLARHLPGGGIDFLGRIDHQVKVRGFRIELGEIEAVLAEHDAVAQAVAMVWTSPAGEEHLVAYAVARRQAPSPRELREHLAAALPEYMVPAFFVFLEKIPLTPNGKVDRKVLPDPDAEGSVAAADVLEPRDDLELRLVRIWEEILDRRPVGVTDNFFELGGHSLLAIRLMSRIREVFGFQLPLATVFAAGTVEEMAGVLRSSEAPARSRQPLVTIQPAAAAERLPFFCVHPVGGNVLCYAELARALGSEQPFYGLQAPDPEDAEVATIEGLAARYLEAIRDVAPDGPLAVGGWSMGGIVAFEMARQLEARGEPAAALVVVDVPAPAARAVAEPLADARLLSLFAGDLGGLVGRPLHLAAEELAGLPATKLLPRAFDAAKAAGVLPPEISFAEAETLFAVFKNNHRALSAYRPQSYGGSMLLVRGSESLPDGDDPTLGWAAWARGGVDVSKVPGSHYSMMKRPNVEALAEYLSRSLKQA